MRLEARKYLHDIDQAMARLSRFVAGRLSKSIPSQPSESAGTVA
jgi:hypothetical protein